MEDLKPFNLAEFAERNKPMIYEGMPNMQYDLNSARPRYNKRSYGNRRYNSGYQLR